MRAFCQRVNSKRAEILVSKSTARYRASIAPTISNVLFIACVKIASFSSALC